MKCPTFMEGNLFRCFHVMFRNRPWISISDRADLLVKILDEMFVNCLEASASSWMGNNHEFVKSRILNVIFPYKMCVRIHTLHERDSFIVTYSFIWVHNNYWDLIFYCPFDLRYHRPQFKIFVQANTSCPDSSPHSTCTLDQN